VAKPLSVLLVEDNEDDAELILLTLRRSGYDVASERVDTDAALAGALARREWDIVLSDYSMPSLTSHVALAIVRESGQRCPFIVVSGAIGEETAVELMRTGAHDCIMKDKLSRLPPAVERELGEARMRRERENALESLRRELKLNATLAELSKNLISIPEDLTPVAGHVLEYAKELTGSTHGYVGTIDARTGTLVALTITEMLEGEACAARRDGEPVSFPRAADGSYGGLWGHALNTKRPFFENDPGRHAAAKGTPEGHVGLEKFLSAPVLSGEDLVGQIAVANPGRDYTPDDLTAIARLADLFSIAVANHRTLLEKEQLSRQLRQVQKIEAIGTLAGGIAHDFNNILTPMIGYAEMVQMCLTRDSKVWRHQEQVLRACWRAKDLVQQILSLSRQTEEGRKPTSLGPIVKEALRLLCSSLPKTIEIREYIDSPCGPVLAEPTQIHQVVMNLCTNAYHAMSEIGGVLGVCLRQVHISPSDAAPAKVPGDYAMLEVSDTGHGMDRKTMEKIFDPYFTTKKAGEGTGLGLSVVESIVRKHGGSISVYSEPGLGATFRVYLPLLKGDPAAEAAPAGGAAMAGKERIMVVDDQGEIAAMAKEMLEDLGYTVDAYTSSGEAFKAFSGNPPAYDLVITDLTMPDMTGIELSRRLMEIRPDIPVILCSGFGETISPEAVASLGIRRLLKKPILIQEYGQAVRQVLDEGGG